jgi:thiamine kinase-like enzyme
MGEFRKFFSSSKRPVLIGKTVTKQMGSKKELDDYIKVSDALKEVGIYEVFTYNPIDLTVTYDYFEGSENAEINKLEDAIKCVSSYSKPTKAKLMTLDQMHKQLSGFQWPKELYRLAGNMNCLTHDDFNKVNLLKTPTGYMPIDWERACLGPQYYDLGSWLVNQVMYQIDNPKGKDNAEKLITEKLGRSNMAEQIMKYALIDALFIQSYKLMIAKQRKVYGLTGLERIIRYLKSQLGV